MKPILFDIPPQAHTSLFLSDQKEVWYEKLHIHPVYQLSMIVNGSGRFAIGDKVSTFQSNDVFLIGPNLPHAFQASTSLVKERNTRIISIFFRENSFGSGFLKLPEMGHLQKLLRLSLQGVRFCRDFSGSLKPRMLHLLEKSGALRLIEVLLVLQSAAEYGRHYQLSTVGQPDTVSAALYSRMNKILNYVAENFERPISLEEAARQVHLSKYAFCRFFKASTQQSFVNYLNQFRISMACRMLSVTTYDITQIGMQTGYNNLSNFNRQFKKWMSCTPREYREALRGFL